VLGKGVQIKLRETLCVITGVYAECRLYTSALITSFGEDENT